MSRHIRVLATSARFHSNGRRPPRVGRSLPRLEDHAYGGVMGGDEARVVEAFMSWLRHGGWMVDAEADFVDVCARRGSKRLYAEAKGRTAAMGLDVDTMYGQLLRRMKDPASGARYAVVVPTVGVQAALRMPAWVRKRLNVDVYEVDDQGVVHLMGSAPV